MILASVILALAAVEKGEYVAQSQSYGPEARGGASRAELIISLEPIDYPMVQNPHIFLALTEEACEKYRYVVHEDGHIILDESLKCKINRTRVHRFPILKTARQEFNNELTCNMISLGILLHFIEGMSPALVEKFITTRLPLSTHEININAFRSGLSMVKYKLKL